MSLDNSNGTEKARSIEMYIVSIVKPIRLLEIVSHSLPLAPGPKLC